MSTCADDVVGDRERARTGLLMTFASLLRRCLLVAAFGFVARANAQDAAAAPALNWVRVGTADGCIAASELADRVEQRVGRVLFVPATQALLSVDGYVSEPEPGRFLAVLAVTQPDGEVIGRRELEVRSDNCRALDEAIILVVAVTLYPNSQLPGRAIPLDATTQEALHQLFGQVAAVRGARASAAPRGRVGIA